MSTRNQIPLTAPISGQNGVVNQQWAFWLQQLQASLPPSGGSYVVNGSSGPVTIFVGAQSERSGSPANGDIYFATDTGNIYVAQGGTWHAQDGTLTGDVLKPAGSSITTLATITTATGTYGSDLAIPQITVNGKGQVTNVTNIPFTPNPTIKLTGDVTGTGNGTVPTVLATVNGDVGTYNYATVTVNEKGLVTGVTQNTPVTSFNTRTGPVTLTSGDVTTALGFTPGTLTSVAATGTNGVTVAGSPITSAGTLTVGLGNITPTSVAATGPVTGSNLSGTNTGDQTITLTGDVTGSGTGSFATTLSTVNSSVGTFSNATVTVDAKGRVTYAATGSGGGGGGGATPNLISGPTTVLADTSYIVENNIQIASDLTIAGSGILVVQGGYDEQGVEHSVTFYSDGDGGTRTIDGPARTSYAIETISNPYASFTMNTQPFPLVKTVQYISFTADVTNFTLLPSAPATTVIGANGIPVSANQMLAFALSPDTTTWVRIS